MTTSNIFHFSETEDYKNESHHLEACSLCGKPLGYDSDIFMYRGNTPFCSNDCRQEQIEFDEAKEKSWKMSNRSHRKSENNQNSTPGNTSRNETVAVA